MANRFWVGGTGTWDATTQTHWSTTTGPGNAPQTAPGSGDVAIFDGASGGGTVTVNWASGTVAVQAITCGAFTGTLDFSANNNNVTLSASGGFNGSGAGTRTINLGNGLWNLSNTTNGVALWTMTTTTGLTFNANSSTIEFSGNLIGSLRGFSGGGLTYNKLQIDAGADVAIQNVGNTFSNLTMSGQAFLWLKSAATQTVTTLAITGTSTAQVGIISDNISAGATISVASGSPSIPWASIRGIAFTGGATFTAPNSFDMGGNTGITITPPVTGGGGIISG